MTTRCLTTASSFRVWTREAMNDPRHWKDGVPSRPTPEDEDEYTRLGPIPSWPTSRPDIFVSSFCLCGHHWSEHHDYRSECEFYGSNVEGGLDASGERHCFRFVDQDQTDDQLVREWHERFGRGP